METTDSQVLFGTKVALVPYLPEFVPTYHHWLQDPYIMEMTCTDETTLEEEQTNQQSYLKDKSKLIQPYHIKKIFLHHMCILIYLIADLNNPSHQPATQPLELVHRITRCETSVLAGDLNLFFGKESELLEQSESIVCAEVSVMVAEEGCRKRGLAEEGVRMLMEEVGVKRHGVTNFIAKISTKNIPSIKLFEKLGYKKLREIEAFEEVHYVYEVCK